MGGGGGPDKTTTIQDIPQEFKPAFTSLYNSAFGAARTAAGQPGWPSQPYGQQSPQATQGQQGFGQQGFGQGGFSDFGTGFNAPTGGGQGGWYPSPGDANANKKKSGVSYQQPTEIFGQKVGGGAGTGIPLASGPPIIGSAYDGQFLAGPSSQTMDSLGMRESLGRSLEGVGDPLTQLGYDTAAGKYLDFMQNPYAQGALMNSLQPAISSFNQSVMPQFNSQALGSGAFKGSSARDLAANQLYDNFGNSLNRTASDFGFQNYMAERQLQQNAGQLMDQGARLNQLAPEILSQAGAGYSDAYQQLLDEQLLQFQEQQQAPFRPLMNLASIIHGGDIGAQTTNFGPQPSRAAGGITGALAGGAGGAGLSSLMGWGNTGTGAATGLGALLGGAAGAFA